MPFTVLSIVHFFEDKFGPDVTQEIFTMKRDLEKFSNVAYKIYISPRPDFCRSSGRAGDVSNLQLYCRGIWDRTRAVNLLKSVDYKRVMNGTYGIQRYSFSFVSTRKKCGTHYKRFMKTIYCYPEDAIGILMSGLELKFSRIPNIYDLRNTGRWIDKLVFTKDLELIKEKEDRILYLKERGKCQALM